MVMLNFNMQIIHSAAAADVSTLAYFIRKEHLCGYQLDILIGDEFPREPMTFPAFARIC